MSSDNQKPSEPTESLLFSYLHVKEEAEAELMLGMLLSDHAEPLIRKIIRAKLRSVLTSPTSHNPQDAEDVRSEVVLHLLTRLRELRANPGAVQIEDLGGYVAAVTYNCYHKYLRKKYPERLRLKNRVRYVLNHHAGLAVWEDKSGEWLCGLAAWMQFDSSTGSRERSRQFSGDLEEFKRLSLPGRSAEKMHPGTLLVAIFTWMQCPVELDELVTIVADLWGIKDQLKPIDSRRDSANDCCETLADPRVNIATQLERRMYLEKLWTEICQLPSRQRVALLLNLRDMHGRDVLALFTLTGVASLHQIADALGMPVEEFAELWNNLPLDDLTIAQRLVSTRQQVINLRKSARERLARRMQLLEGKP